MIEIVPALIEDRAVLWIANREEHPVTIRRVFVSCKNPKTSDPVPEVLRGREIRLRPQEEQTVDVSKPLLEIAEEEVWIMTDLHPTSGEPLGPELYRIKMKGKRIVEFAKC